MRISVVTASFNQGPYIKKCLESVRRQAGNFQIEHIILDNCSTDESAALLDDYQNNPGKVDVKLFVRPDKGQTAAINEGFALATGDVVCWLNTDEWYEEDALQTIVSFFNSKPEVDVVFGDCDFVDRQGRLIKRKKEHFFSKTMLIYYGCFMPSCSTFVRRKILDKGFYLDPSFKVTMDFDWYVRIASAGFIISHLPKTLASFTWHDTNISSTFSERRRQERLLIQESNSKVPGPKHFRFFVYWIMKYFWMIVRYLIRRARAHA